MNDAANGDEARAAFVTRMEESAARHGEPVGPAQGRVLQASETVDQ